MKIKKILIYITAVAAALAMASAAYAEDDGAAPFLDFEEDTMSEPEESADTSETTEFEPIVLPIVSDSTDSDTSEPTDTEETSSDMAVVDPMEFETDPTDESSSEEPTDSTDESTTEPDILWEDTTSAPEISMGTDPEPVTEASTAAPTEASTAAPATQSPAADPTESSAAEPVTLGTQSAVTTVSETPITTENDTTTAPPVLTTPSNFDDSNIAGVDPAGSDDLLTTILWIVAGVLAFVLVLVLPPVIRRIRKNIIYKYD